MVLDGRVVQPGERRPGQRLQHVLRPDSQEGRGGVVEEEDPPVDRQRAASARKPPDELGDGRGLGRAGCGRFRRRQDPWQGTWQDGVTTALGLLKQRADALAGPDEGLTLGGCQLRRVRPGPHQYEPAPVGCSGADGGGAQGELVGQDERRARIAAGQLLLAAEPDQAPQAYGVGHRDRSGQRHPGPGGRQLTGHPRQHGQVQHRVVRRQQVEHRHGRFGLAHDARHSAVQQLRAGACGGGRGGLILHIFQRPS